MAIVRQSEADTRIEEILKKVRRIEIWTRRLVNDFFAGGYHSAFKGQGMEFEEVREYQVGDDIRQIDWNVTARVGTPYIKKFREERELSIMLLVDSSSSGAFGTRDKFKVDLAAELSGVLAFSAIKNNDKVGMISFTDRVEKFIPPKKGRQQVLRLIREIVTLEPKGTRTDITMALEFFNRVVKKRSIVFLISDFMAEDFMKPLQIANNKHDIIAVKIADPREVKFENVGLIELEDAETGETLIIDTGSRRFRQEFTQEAENDNIVLRQALNRIGLDLIYMISDRDYIPPLKRFFQMRGKRR